jgi:hypothetical protein
MAARRARNNYRQDRKSSLLEVEDFYSWPTGKRLGKRPAVNRNPLSRRTFLS